MTRRRLYLLLLYLLPMIMWAEDFSVYKGRRYSVRDGLPSNVVNCIRQSEDGSIWIGTSNGLSVYDGYQFRNIRPKVSMGTSLNISLFNIDEKNGLIWLFTTRRQHLCLDMRTHYFVDYTGRNDDGRSFYGSNINGSDVWLNDHDIGVRHIEPKGGRKFIVSDYTAANGMLPNNRNLFIHHDSHGNTFVQTKRGFLIVYTDGLTRLINVDNDVVGSVVYKDTLYYMTGGGKIVRWSDGHERVIGRMAKNDVALVNGNYHTAFVWRGKWLLFTPTVTYAFDFNDGSVTRPADCQIPNAIDNGSLAGMRILSDDSGNLFFFSDESVRRLHLIDNTSLQRSSTRPFSLAQDRKGTIFIATKGNGLFAYNYKDSILRHYKSTDPQPSFSSDYLLSIAIDREDGLWLGSDEGLFYISRHFDESHARYVVPRPHGESQENYVRYVTKLPDGAIYAATRSGGLYTFDTSTDALTSVSRGETSIYALAFDKTGRRWVGTRGGGLIVGDVTYSKNDSLHFIPVNDIRDIVCDRKGQMWIATFGGGLLLCDDVSRRPLTFSHFLYNDYVNSRSRDLLLVGDRLWIASDNGVSTIDIRRRPRSDSDFLNFSSANGMLPAGVVFSLSPARNASFWAASDNGAFLCSFDEKTSTLKYSAVNITRGLVNNNARGVAEDRNGRAWIATEEGISRYDPISNSIQSFFFGKTLAEDNYTEGQPVNTDDGRILFGTRSGLMILSPSQDSTNQEPARVTPHITSILINGSDISEYADETRIEGDSIMRLTVPHNLNTFTIYFSNCSFQPQRISLYQYLLEGVDKDWHRATSLNYADYTQLKPGRYKLRLRNPLNIDSGETVLFIHVRQPWWNTWLARLIYLLLIAALVTVVYRQWRRNFLLRRQMELEQNINKFRLDFFTHVTHEFRSPLAIIKSGIDSIKQRGLQESGIQLQTITRGTERLSRLIDHLLHFRQLSTGQAKLNVEEGNIIALIKDIYSDFYISSQQQGQTFAFKSFERKYKMVFDPQSVELIVSNLVSNALKYTPEGGHITLEILSPDNSIPGNPLSIVVEDDGPGIATEQQKQLFQPFMHGLASYGGMGIGLYSAFLTARLHHGTLSYESSEGGGSRFIFKLPTQANIYSSSDYRQLTAVKNKTVSTILPFEMNLPEASLNPDVYVILVEDDYDMMIQEKKLLSAYFTVEGCFNGHSAIVAAEKRIPDLIICDMMLPDMSGLDVVRRLRAQPTTATIPIIILTVMEEEERQLNAIKAGANDYMIKPCNANLLIAKSFYLIKQQRQIRRGEQAKKTDISFDDADQMKAGGGNDAPLVTNFADKVFLQKVLAIMESNYSNPYFNMEHLAQMLGTGRTKTYYKIRVLTGKSPNVYLQEMRLKYAADMLLSNDLNVSEVSYKVGFLHSTYFSKVFKQYYGMKPSEYAKKGSDKTA